MTFPGWVLDYPFPLRVPHGPNEHQVPFAKVTWDRLEKGIWYHVRDLRRSGALSAFDRLPDGYLLMHPADYIDLVTSDMPSWVTQMFAWPPSPFGYDLIQTMHPDYARAGRPRLRLNDGTDVLL